VPPVEGEKPPERPVDPPATPATTDKVETNEPPSDPAKATQDTTEPFIKLPDGVVADTALLEKAVPLFKELGLKGEQAQRVVDLYVARQAEQATQNAADWAEQDKAWVKEVKDDKELGGEKLEANVRKARQAVAKLAPDLPEELTRLGLANHPGFLRLFHRISQAIGDDTISGKVGGAVPAKLSGDQALTHELYPSMRPKE
jgi:hypothetical protein